MARAGNIKITIEGNASALADAARRIAAAQEAQADVMRALKASIDAQLAFAGQVSAVTSQQAVRAMADLMSAQLGKRAGMRRDDDPGAGSLARL